MKKPYTKFGYTYPNSKKLDRDSVFGGMYSYRMYLDQFLNIAISMFKWTAPDTVSTRYLEQSLIWNGMVCVFEDEAKGILALPCMPTGYLDVYGDPIKVRVYGANGYHRTLRNHTDCVVIWNDMLHLPMIQRLQWYAQRLYQLDEIETINVNAQKTPFVLSGTEGQKLTLENLFSKVEENCPVIYKNKTDLNNLDVLHTEAPYVADKIQDLKRDLWNEALTYIGVPNVTHEKKERLIRDEVTQQFGGTQASGQSRIDSRKTGSKEVTELLNVEFEVENQFVEGEVKDGSLHSRSTGYTGINEPDEPA